MVLQIIYLIGIGLAIYSMYRAKKMVKELQEHVNVMLLMKELYGMVLAYDVLMSEATNDELEKLRASWKKMDLDNDIINMTSKLRSMGVPIVWQEIEGRKYVYIEEAK